nr:uncharacterized protein LOC112029950 [Quercus suber]
MVLFFELRDNPSSIAGTQSEYRRRFTTRRQLRAGTILSTQGHSPFAALGQNLLPSSCAISILKEKRVSVRFVSTDFFIHTSFLKKSKCFSFAEMTSKFNKDMYAKMRVKKDELFSSIGKKTVRMTRRGPSVTPTASVTPIVSSTRTTRTASPSTSIEELPTPVSKKPRLLDKEKEKVDSRPSTIWGDKRLVVNRAHGIVTAVDLKVFSGVPFNNVASGHVHKLVQVLGESLHIASEYLTQEAKLASLTLKMQALEGENSKLKKNLIDSMDEATTLKEKVKTLGDDLKVERQLTLEKDEQLLNAKVSLKTIATISIEAF